MKDMNLDLSKLPLGSLKLNKIEGCLEILGRIEMALSSIATGKLVTENERKIMQLTHELH